jgi:multisubunit Na+/H+ antiporter MnhF subunit
MVKKRRVSTHVLPTSATMIGVCMTVINLVQLTEVHRGNTRADEVLAVDSLFFMLSAFCSYISMRRDDLDPVGIGYEKVADIAFILGLLTIAGVLITYQLV